MTKKILITGGAVEGMLDSVKIITNKFKGGLMAGLTDNLFSKYPCEIWYITSKDGMKPSNTAKMDTKSRAMTEGISIIEHQGIHDYMRIVCELAPQMDAVVLGAAVCNLIPKNKIEGKFPSHNYKEGDIIPIDFTIAPRIIDQVKEVNPKCLLFGFKLLSGVDHDELIRAAYGVLLESKAVTIFANDSKNLSTVYAVTKDRGVHTMNRSEIANWIIERMEEKYYSTEINESDLSIEEEKEMEESKEKFCNLLLKYKDNFIKTDEGYIFGAGAISLKNKKFITTVRGKKEIEKMAFVKKVDHENRKIYCLTDEKASLNAPLFDYIFTRYPIVKSILHFHHQRDDLITQKYATPGTDKDSKRNLVHPSFNIEGHGCILSFDQEGNMLI